MERLLRLVEASWLGRLPRWRYYVPVALATLFLLLGLTVAQLLARAGVLSLPLGGAHPDISITGPDAPGDATTMQMYVLGAVVAPGV